MRDSNPRSDVQISRGNLIPREKRIIKKCCLSEQFKLLKYYLYTNTPISLSQFEKLRGELSDQTKKCYTSLKLTVGMWEIHGYTK